jgi:hypothetical protein
MSDTAINLDSIQAEVANMDLEALKAAVLKAKVKQKVATKKYYNPEAAKRARDKRAAELKAMTELLRSKGLLDEVEAQARQQADEQLATEAAEETETVEA